MTVQPTGSITSMSEYSTTQPPPPRMLDLAAAELWTGDLTDEGRIVFALDRFRREGYVMVTLATPRLLPLEDGDDWAQVTFDHFEDRPYLPDDALRVVRDAPMPDGSFLYRYGLAKDCHGTVLSTGEPCACGEIHTDDA